MKLLFLNAIPWEVLVRLCLVSWFRISHKIVFMESISLALDGSSLALPCKAYTYLDARKLFDGR